MAPHAEIASADETILTPSRQPAVDKRHSAPDVDADMRMHDGSRELFDYCTQLHKASLLGLVHVGLIDKASAKRIAHAVTKAAADHECPDEARSLDYLDFESRMTKICGSEASLLHLGRSRQDMLSTYNRQMLRTRTLAIMKTLNDCRTKLLQIATTHAETVVPMYTHGVPAQPTTFGHCMLAYAEAFERAFLRFDQSYRSVNQSPLGAAVGCTSSFPLDRRYLAFLLGFDGVVENSWGANHVASIDAIQDVVSPLTIVALHIGTFAQDMTVPQAAVRPWLSTAARGFTGPSSIMPQKRNPRILEFVRGSASQVLGGSHMAAIISHNCTSGLTDTRESFSKLPLQLGVDMLDLFGELLDSIEIDKEQALYQVTYDFSTVTQIADILFTAHRVPFRTGHHFASKLVDYGRSQGIGPTDISYEKARNIYTQISETDFPLTAEELSDCVCPTKVVQSRKGLGGPQVSEVTRMLVERKNTLQRDEDNLQQCLARQEQADAKLQKEFVDLMTDTHTNGNCE